MTVCRHCGGPLAGMNLSGAARCTVCGKGTVVPCGRELDCEGTCGRRQRHEGDCACFNPKHHHESDVDPRACNAPLPCGGTCYLPKDHLDVGPCLCRGDDGKPDTCPA